MTVENQDELKKRAAVMYYRDDMTQAEIARALYLSRTKISRLLKAAKEENIVDIRINGGFRRNDYLEHIFEERYGLKEAVILADIPGGEEEALRTVARAAAEYIDSILTKDYRNRKRQDASDGGRVYGAPKVSADSGSAADWVTE